jgi:hypothetical protein
MSGQNPLNCLMSQRTDCEGSQVDGSRGFHLANMAPASSTVSPAQTPTEQNIFGLVLPRTAEAYLLAGWLASENASNKKAII